MKVAAGLLVFMTMAGCIQFDGREDPAAAWEAVFPGAAFEVDADGFITTRAVLLEGRVVQDGEPGPWADDIDTFVEFPQVTLDEGTGVAELQYPTRQRELQVRFKAHEGLGNFVAFWHAAPFGFLDGREFPNASETRRGVVTVQAASETLSIPLAEGGLQVVSVQLSRSQYVSAGTLVTLHPFYWREDVSWDVAGTVWPARIDDRDLATQLPASNAVLFRALAWSYVRAELNGDARGLPGDIDLGMRIAHPDGSTSTGLCAQEKGRDLQSVAPEVIDVGGPGSASSFEVGVGDVSNLGCNRTDYLNGGPVDYRLKIHQSFSLCWDEDEGWIPPLADSC